MHTNPLNNCSITCACTSSFILPQVHPLTCLHWHGILDLIRWNVDLDCADSRFIASVLQWSALKHVTSPTDTKWSTQAVLKGWRVLGWRSCKQSVGWFSLSWCDVWNIPWQWRWQVQVPTIPLQLCQHLALSPRCSHYSACRTVKMLLTCTKITTTHV